MPTNGTSRMACVLSQRGRAKQGRPPSNSWASSEALSDQVWLEDLIGPLYNQPSTRQPSCPSAPSSEGTDSLCSWSSGVTCLLHNSIKKQSQEVFETRLGDARRRAKLAGCAFREPHGGGHPWVENDRNKLHAWPESGGLCQGSGPKIEAKVKFSQFLDEVTFNVLDPDSLQAFGKTTSRFTSTTPPQPEDGIKTVTPWGPRLPCSVPHQLGFLLEQKKTPGDPNPCDLVWKTYQESDIDSVRRHCKLRDPQIKVEPRLATDDKSVIPPPPQFSEGFEEARPFPEFHHDFRTYPHRSASLPRGINMVSDESRPSL